MSQGPRLRKTNFWKRTTGALPLCYDEKPKADSRLFFSSLSGSSEDWRGSFHRQDNIKSAFMACLHRRQNGEAPSSPSHRSSFSWRSLWKICSQRECCTELHGQNFLRGSTTLTLRSVPSAAEKSERWVPSLILGKPNWGSIPAGAVADTRGLRHFSGTPMGSSLRLFFERLDDHGLDIIV